MIVHDVITSLHTKTEHSGPEVEWRKCTNCDSVTVFSPVTCQKIGKNIKADVCKCPILKKKPDI